MSGSINSLGMYTAPSVTSPASVTVTATSQADPSKSAFSVLTVNPASLSFSGQAGRNKSHAGQRELHKHRGWIAYFHGSERPVLAGTPCEFRDRSLHAAGQPVHQCSMVQARTRIMNQLQAVALNEGLRCKKRLWREHGREQLESFRLAPWASRRRQDLLELLNRLNPTIAELSQAIEQEAEKFSEARWLMTHPGVGPLTALAFVLIIGEADRFQCGKQVASYLGLVPLEDSSGNRRRLGHITKQGSSMLRFLLVEAAQVTVRSLPEWRSKYFHLMMRRGRKIAKVAMARRLAIRLYWMWRKGWDYEQVKKFGSHAGQLGTGDGVQ